jgi:hypothetical protein
LFPRARSAVLQNAKLSAAYADASCEISRRGADNAPIVNELTYKKDKLAEFGGVNGVFNWR